MQFIMNILYVTELFRSRGDKAGLYHNDYKNLLLNWKYIKNWMRYYVSSTLVGECKEKTQSFTKPAQANKNNTSTKQAYRHGSWTAIVYRQIHMSESSGV